MTDFNLHNQAFVEIAGLAGLGAFGLTYERMLEAQRRRLAGYERFDVGFPRGVEVDAAVHALVDLLAPLRRKQGIRVFDVIIIEIMATDGRIRHAIEVPAERVEYVQSSLYANIPGLRLLENARTEVEPAPRAAVELTLTNSAVPLRADAPDATNRSILASLQPLRRGEVLKLTWLLANGEPPYPLVRAWPMVPNDRLGDRSDPTSDQMDAAVRRKHALPLVAAVGRIGAWTDDVPRAHQLIGRVQAATQSVAVPGARIVRRGFAETKAVRRMVRRDVPPVEFPSVFNAREMIAILGIPLDSPSLPGVELVQGRPLAPAKHLPSTGRPVGTATYPGRQYPIAAPFDSTERHSWTVGPSGSGKSVLLVNQILADLEAPDHRAVIAFDMKVDTIDRVLERYPERRDDAVAILDVSSDRPVGYNPLYGSERHPEVTADALFGILKRLWRLDNAPRTLDLLHVSLLTLCFRPGAALPDLAPLLTNRAYRAKVTSHLQEDPVMASYWASFEAMSDGERAQVIAPLLTRVRQVLLRSQLRAVLGQPESTIDFGEILNKGKVLLVPLGAGLIGPESAALLAALLLAGLWSAAQARAAFPAERRRPVAVFIDEFQVAAAGVTDMADVLALARGYNIGFALANQSPTQLSAALREAVAVNAATKLCFGTSAADAATMAKEFGHGISAADIQGLGRFEVMASIALANATAPPVTVLTRPLGPVTREVGELRRRSAERYGRPRAEVEAELRARFATTPGVSNPGVRRRQP